MKRSPLAVVLFVLALALSTLAASPRAGADEDERLTPAVVTLEFEDVPVIDALVQLAKRTGRNVIVDPRLKGRVTLDLKDADVRQAFELVALAAGARVVEEAHGILRVMPLRAEAEETLRYYDVKDLVEAVPHLLERLRKLSPGASALEMRNGIVIARADAATHRALDRLLRGVRAELADPEALRDQPAAPPLARAGGARRPSAPPRAPVPPPPPALDVSRREPPRPAAPDGDARSLEHALRASHESAARTQADLERLLHRAQAARQTLDREGQEEGEADMRRLVENLERLKAATQQAHLLQREAGLRAERGRLEEARAALAQAKKSLEAVNEAVVRLRTQAARSHASGAGAAAAAPAAARPEAEGRAEHLLQAARHLRLAGMVELAERLEREARTADDGVLRAVEALRNEVRALRREVEALKGRDR